MAAWMDLLEQLSQLSALPGFLGLLVTASVAPLSGQMLMGVKGGGNLATVDIQSNGTGISAGMKPSRKPSPKAVVAGLTTAHSSPTRDARTPKARAVN